MNSRDIISLCVRNLMRRRTRTILAVMGVIVGTCAIVVMLSIGFGLSEGYKAQIESYGNLHLINVYSWGGGLNSDGKPIELNEKSIAAIEKMQGVDAVSPILSEYMTICIGKYVAQVEISGIRPEVMEKLGYDIQEGRLLRQNDKYEIVFGNQVPSWFYNPRKSQGYVWGGEPQVDVITDKMILTSDPYYGQKKPQGMGGMDSSEESKIDYPEYKAKGVGILANPNDDSAYRAFMNIDTLKVIQEQSKKARKEPPSFSSAYNTAMVYVADLEQIETISEKIREMGFETHSLNDWLESTKSTSRMIQAVLGGIGGISLLVAALGITNTMVMSIFERTKEIGVMKVIGANLKDIRKMFLLEAGLIGFFGGLLGVIASYLLSWLMNNVLINVMSSILQNLGSMGTSISIIPWEVALGALLFSTFIGLASGYSPARRAMNLSALESLKNE